jgi:U3 small nucleolar RNA-associated protein 4
VSHDHAPLQPLLALTTTHTLHEFDLSTSSFTSWSRRNPTSTLPARFQRIKDRVMGAFFTSASRLWLYGAGWLYMLDISRDFPARSKTLSSQPESASAEGEASSGKKRKRGNQSLPQTLRGTGAGSKIMGRRDRDGAVAARTGLKYEGTDGPMKVIPLDHGALQPLAEDDGDVDMMDIDGDEAGEGSSSAPGTLVARRRGSQAAEAEDRKGGARDEGSAGPGEYVTYRYRAIFGMGVLSSPFNSPSRSGDGEGVFEKKSEEENEETDRVEIVIVERPMYEVPQTTARFDGGQDWDA